MKIMNKKKLLILNISTDSIDTSLGFAISWLNIFSKECDEINVITLNKGETSNLNENINIYEVENESKVRRILSFIKILNKLTKNNRYSFCLSHMSALLIIISFPILKIRKIRSVLWYTHQGPKNLFKKLILLQALLLSSNVITASKYSFPYKNKKVNSIGHAIDYDLFYKEVSNFDKKDFAIISRISKSKKIDESITGFLNSNLSESNNISIIGEAITKEDQKYKKYLIEKYKNYKNVIFLGSIPHSQLTEYLNDIGFHINNTDKGFYDKSVLETSIHGIVNLYQNIDYDKNIPSKYIKYLRFNGSSEDLSNKLSNLVNINEKEFMEIIKFSQKEIKKESLVSLYKRIINSFT